MSRAGGKERYTIRVDDTEGEHPLREAAHQPAESSAASNAKRRQAQPSSRASLSLAAVVPTLISVGGADKGSDKESDEGGGAEGDEASAESCSFSMGEGSFKDKTPPLLSQHRLLGEMVQKAASLSLDADPAHSAPSPLLTLSAWGVSSSLQPVPEASIASLSTQGVFACDPFEPHQSANAPWLEDDLLPSAAGDRGLAWRAANPFLDPSLDPSEDAAASREKGNARSISCECAAIDAIADCFVKSGGYEASLPRGAGARPSSHSTTAARK